jgi:MOSC domain-containing protein YiiM
MIITQASGHVAQVNVNPSGGVPKYAVASTRITFTGVAGDKQRNRRFHGGPQRAVSLFAAELIDTLRAEGHPVAAGAAGENLTIVGLDWAALRIGDRLRIGQHVLVEITGYAAPCTTIAGAFADGDFTRISQKLHPGWSRLYAKVLAEGEVRQGDPVELVARDAPGGR